MARNHDKYNYIEIAVSRDSPLHQALLAESAASGRSLSAVALSWLADHLRMSGQPASSGIFAPPPPALPRSQFTSPLPVVSSQTAPMPAQQVLPEPSAPTPQAAAPLIQEQAKGTEAREMEELPEFDPAKGKANADLLLNVGFDLFG